jgi:hypothetical protein
MPTLRNLRLRPGAALMKKTLNNRRPRVVAPSNFFPGPTARPTINVIPSVPPTEVSPQSLFPDPKPPSPFNFEPRTLRLRNKQAKAIQNSEKTGVLAFPMNESFLNTPKAGGRTRKNKRRKHSRK